MLVPLAELEEGADAEIVRLAEHDGDLLHWFYEQGLVRGRRSPDARRSRRPGRVAVDGAERALGEKAARRVYVRARRVAHGPSTEMLESPSAAPGIRESVPAGNPPLPVTSGRNKRGARAADGPPSLTHFLGNSQTRLTRARLDEACIPSEVE